MGISLPLYNPTHSIPQHLCPGRRIEHAQFQDYGRHYCADPRTRRQPASFDGWEGTRCELWCVRLVNIVIRD